MNAPDQPKPGRTDGWAGVIEDALDLNRIKLAAMGILAAGLILAGATFVASFLYNSSLHNRIIVNVLTILGWAAVFIVVALFHTALAWLTAEAGAGRKRGAGEALGFSFSNVASSIGTPAVLAFVAAGIVIVEALVFAVGRIRAVSGIVGAAVFGPASLVNTVLLVALVAVGGLGAAVIANRREGPGGALSGAFKMLKSKTSPALPKALYVLVITGLAAAAIGVVYTVASVGTVGIAAKATDGRILLAPRLPVPGRAVFGGLSAFDGAEITAILSRLIFLVVSAIVMAVLWAYPWTLFAQGMQSAYRAGEGALGAAAPKPEHARAPSASAPRMGACPQCRAPLETGAVFCSTCGARFTP